jgi:hypothetical protein
MGVGKGIRRRSNGAIVDLWLHQPRRSTQTVHTRVVRGSTGTGSTILVRLPLMAPSTVVWLHRWKIIELTCNLCRRRVILFIESVRTSPLVLLNSLKTRFLNTRLKGRAHVFCSALPLISLRGSPSESRIRSVLAGNGSLQLVRSLPFVSPTIISNFQKRVPNGLSYSHLYFKEKTSTREPLLRCLLHIIIIIIMTGTTMHPRGSGQVRSVVRSGQAVTATRNQASNRRDED